MNYLLIIIITVTALGCNGRTIRTHTLEPYTEQTEQGEQTEQPKYRVVSGTICSDEIANELEPELPAMLATAVAYWHDNGHTSLVLGEGGCDAIVRFVGESDPKAPWKADTEAAIARTYTNSAFVLLRELTWQDISDRGYREIVLIHEIGHLLLGPEHTDSGIMAADGGISENPLFEQCRSKSE